MNNPSYGGVVLTSMLTSVAVSLAVFFGIRKYEEQNGPITQQAAQQQAAAEMSSVEVPSVVGIPRDTAAEVLRGRKLRMLVAEEVESAEYDRGKVVSQEPLAGSEVNESSEITVKISSGAPQITVPILTGKTLDEARAEITGLGLTVGEVTEGGEGTPGSITSSDPLAGTILEPGSAVKLVVVAAGSEVPEVVGLNIRRARAAITEAGFKVGRVRYRYSESRSAYTVLAQEPEAGATAEPETEINLTVNED